MKCVAPDRRALDSRRISHWKGEQTARTEPLNCLTEEGMTECTSGRTAYGLLPQSVNHLDTSS